LIIIILFPLHRGEPLSIMSTSNTATTPPATSTSNISQTSPEMSKQPPFPEPGTGGAREPAPKHPHAERIINATARHIIPDNPAPSAEDDEDKAHITKPGSEEREAREEEPLLKGTPLDELNTPGIGLPSSAPNVEAIKEEPSRSTDKDAREGAIKRPGLSAMRGVGSDSVSLPQVLNDICLEGLSSGSETDYVGSYGHFSSVLGSQLTPYGRRRRWR
jgi:hypothetical protein